MELIKVDITKCWLDYHFPVRIDKQIYYKMIYNVVKECCGKYWCDSSFNHYISLKVIDYLAFKDWFPFSKAMILLSINNVFYDLHIQYVKWHDKRGIL